MARNRSASARAHKAKDAAWMPFKNDCHIRDQSRGSTSPSLPTPTISREWSEKMGSKAQYHEMDQKRYNLWQLDELLTSEGPQA